MLLHLERKSINFIKKDIICSNERATKRDLNSERIIKKLDIHLTKFETEVKRESGSKDKEMLWDWSKNRMTIETGKLK